MLHAAAAQLRSIAWHHTILRDADGAITGTLSSGEDVTERLAAEQQITYLAYHDTLTGLPNRTLLEEHLELALARARRTGAGVALLHLDLDNFKLVNDSLGHGAGDELICGLAARLQQSVRATDLLARTGGDGFLVLLADLHDDPLAVGRAGGGRDRRLPRGAVHGRRRRVPGVGVDRDRAEPARRGATPRRCWRTPTRRCTRPRTPRAAAGRSTRQAGRDPLERLSMAARLRRALAAEEFQLHYQPIFASGGGLVGVEALLRWHDPERGGAGAAERVHPRGRGDRPDRVDRRLGDRRRVRAAGRVGGARADPAGLRQRLAAPAPSRRLPRARQRAPARERRRPGADHGRADRVGDAPGPRRRRADPARAARARAAARARRLRRRLLVALAPARDADGDAQDRPRVPARGARERRGVRDRHRDPAAGPRARPHRRGGGRRDRGAAALPRRSSSARCSRASCSPGRCRRARSRR